MTNRYPHRAPRALLGVLLSALLCAPLLLGGGGLRAPLARADVSSPSALGPDESLSAPAGPLVAGTTYSGTFSSPSDVDYLYFEVPAPETLRFDVVNTLSSCNPYWIEAPPGEASPGEPVRYFEPFPSCPLWATLLDGSGRQLGGEGSAAGSGPVEFSSYEDIEWTFSTPGRYYLVLESEYCGGHPGECQLPSFQLSFGVAPPSGSGGGSGGGTGGGSGGKATGGGTTKGSGSGGPNGGAGGGSQGAGSLGGPLSSSYESHQAESPAGRGSSHALIRSLSVSRRQRGMGIGVSLLVVQRLRSLDLWVLTPIGAHRRLTVVGHLQRHHPIPGRERLLVPVRVGRWLTGRRYTPVVLRVRALGSGNAYQIFQRRLLLRR